MATRRNRLTRTMISVELADDCGLDDEGGHSKWYTICEDHNEICGHATKALATSWAAEPSMWCEGCKTIAYPNHERSAA